MKDESGLSPWQTWSYEVQQKLKAQQQQIEQLECTIADICGQLKKLEARPTHNIEKIEYHFDQLKVEKLDGTLNIGMSAPDSGAKAGQGDGVGGISVPDNIEQLSIGGGNGMTNTYPSAAQTIQPPAAPYQDIYRKLNYFLDTEAHQQLIQHGQELNLPLDPHHRKIIIEDVRKQLPPRIHYYLQQHVKDNTEHSDLFPDLLADKVYAKARRDAETAILAYVRKLKAGSPSNGG
ncbi:spore germination protein GerPC [Paenibacillus sp. GCM10027627]|uniref:spore germination protein GerPC n=1 Tax=unclassified Paenibacillus TaxID=185978 RepID=UPI00363E6B14